MMKEGLPTFVLVWHILANRGKKKDWFLCKNMYQSMSRNWENSSSMHQSPPKYIFSIEIEISATVFSVTKFILTLNCRLWGRSNLWIYMYVRFWHIFQSWLELWCKLKSSLQFEPSAIDMVVWGDKLGDCIYSRNQVVHIAKHLQLPLWNLRLPEARKKKWIDLELVN